VAEVGFTMLSSSPPARSSGSSLVFIAGLLAGSSIALLVNHIVHRHVRRRREFIDDEVLPSSAMLLSQQQQTSTTTTTLPSEIRMEMLSRNSLYFDAPSSSSSNDSSSTGGGMERITNAHVLIVGLGGVGSHIAHMLARSGIKYIRLIDFDMITVSSLNRHAVATMADVGLPKAIVLANHLRQICPDTTMLILDPIVRMVTGNPDIDGNILDPPPSSLSTSGGCWDVVIDAIDDVPTKTLLIAHFAKQQQQHGGGSPRILSCMGAGGKADPTRIHISDLRSACRDPLAASVRQRLRLLGKKEAKQNNGTIKSIIDGSGVTNGGWLSCLDDESRLAVIYSSEQTVAKLADITPEQKTDGIHNFGSVDNMRVRILPVLGTMPAIMGQALAALALCELGGKAFTPMNAERVGRNVRHRLYQHLKSREKKLEDRFSHSSSSSSSIVVTTTLVEGGSTTVNGELNDNNNKYSNNIYVGPIMIDPDDVEYIMSELWKNQCAISGDRLGTTLELHRWDRSRPAMPNNLVLLSAKTATKFEDDFEKFGDGRLGVDEAIRRRVDARLRLCVLGAEDVY
jgi:tRNA A37 threonylcarbamoyladenosine dehydratase